MVDFSRKKQDDYHELLIDRARVERVDTFKYLGTTISRYLDSSH